MQRIDTQDGLYHDADTVNGVQGTVVKAAALNALQEEIIAVITAAGITLDPEADNQLYNAILAVTGNGQMAWGAIYGAPDTATRWPTVAEVTGLTDALAGKMPTSWTLSAGDGLTGGGNGSGDRTVSLGAPSTITGNTDNTVSGETHSHALDIVAADVGLGAVDDTSDADKPVSTAQQAALDGKADKSTLDTAGIPVSVALTDVDDRTSDFCAWSATSGIAHTPASGQNYAGLTLQGFNANNGGQLAIGNLGRLFFRGKTGGVMGGWEEAARRSGETFTGTVTAPGFNSSASSRHAKHDIRPIRHGLATLCRLPWVEYRYNADVSVDDSIRFGSVIEAGDGLEGVEDVAPELVIRRDGHYPTLDYTQFIAIIGRALQEYIDDTNAWRARVDNHVRVMRTRISCLENR